eukprot:CAMPEP_0198512506 /NCGR_PEP_ID=MMETSP1462-20131121/15496_1 /TAXON_ID=1333877 /ORGANISM="Brandtodinium nutriculum, Strain RCC3387" /LENGTH=96 /DNA_ID=CAMNT_0044241913 /DNA_START=133 /DNA_END=420 /DNA_ORIENTATION=-
MAGRGDLCPEAAPLTEMLAEQGDASPHGRGAARSVGMGVLCWAGIAAVAAAVAAGLVAHAMDRHADLALPHAEALRELRDAQQELSGAAQRHAALS